MAKATTKTDKPLQIITLTSLKGGVAKTTTAMEFAECLNRRGRKTLLIDMDGQCSLSFVCGALWDGAKDAEHSIAAVFDNDNPKAFKDVVTTTKYYGDIVCGHETMYNANTQIAVDDAIADVKKALKGLRGLYDFVIFDTPPALSVLTMATLAVANYVIIPVHADVMSLQSIHHTYMAINAIRERHNKQLKCGGVLFTEITSRLLLTRNMIGTMEEHCKTLKLPTFNTRIRKCVSVQECTAVQLTLHEHDPNCTTAQDYDAAVTEFLKREGL